MHSKQKKLLFYCSSILKAVKSSSLFVSLVYCAENTVRWFIMREKHYWMAANSADKSKRTGQEKHASLGQRVVACNPAALSVQLVPR
jgi:hypothetical protein